MTDRNLEHDALTLRSLHIPGAPLMLANAWDALTATIIANTGAPAIATSSVAVARAHGYEDNDTMPVDVAFDAIRTISRAVDLPVTADIEAGYGLPARELVERLLAAGAVGCNLEDSDHHGPGTVVPMAAHADRIAAVRAAASAAGVPIVINARVDHFHHTKDHAALLDDGIERARAYLAAGADCVYPIFLGDRDLVARFVAEVDGPVNILTRPGIPSVGELADLGVARISMGGGLLRVVTDAITNHVSATFAAAPAPSPA
ncbi:MAG TPA: isocitrate lyase/phosphoenolpyruvate mutase family protein [Tepidiformaceae bacterium]|nr:isocitrate lyase/phosphoenolpyruvate mutase family protein [Tepidiformaceae bacterium]